MILYPPYKEMMAFATLILRISQVRDLTHTLKPTAIYIFTQHYTMHNVCFYQRQPVFEYDLWKDSFSFCCYWVLLILLSGSDRNACGAAFDILMFSIYHAIIFQVCFSLSGSIECVQRHSWFMEISCHTLLSAHPPSWWEGASKASKCPARALNFYIFSLPQRA